MIINKMTIIMMMIMMIMIDFNCQIIQNLDLNNFLVINKNKTVINIKNIIVFKVVIYLVRDKK